MSGAGTATTRRSSREPKAPKRAFGRSLDDFDDLSSAEKTLLDSCRKGEEARLGDTRPEEQTEANRVRAGFVRFLALGGDDSTPVHEQGVSLRGAWLDGVLDLESATATRRLALWNCRIEEIDARRSRLASLSLNGSFLERGIAGDELRCDGAIFLRGGFHSTGEVRLLGATIHGPLVCNGARFECRPKALSCDGASISGPVYLNAGFQALGEVRFPGAMLGSHLVCEGGSFDNEADVALSLDGARVAGTFFFRSLGAIKGAVVLIAMTVHHLNDDVTSWEGARGRLLLDGFSYERLSGKAPVEAKTRIAWLDAQLADHLTREFRPQPWEQLVTVLRSMGHTDEARAIAIAKHQRMRDAGRYVGGSFVWDWIYGNLVGYGYQPWKLLKIVAIVWLACSLVYWPAVNPQWFGAETHLISPGKPQRQLVCELLGLAKADQCREARRDYRDFFVPAYSAEVMLPVVTLGYKAEWRPVVTTSGGDPLPLGWAVRIVYWFEIIFGWLASLLLIAAVGNLVKKE